MSTKVFSFSDSVGIDHIWNRDRFFDISGVFWAPAPVEDVIFATIYAFNFITFVLLDRALGVMVITRAFITAG